jgi:hypothetical protein
MREPLQERTLPEKVCCLIEQLKLHQRQRSLLSEFAWLFQHLQLLKTAHHLFHHQPGQQQVQINVVRNQCRQKKVRSIKKRQVLDKKLSVSNFELCVLSQIETFINIYTFGLYFWSMNHKCGYLTSPW